MQKNSKQVLLKYNTVERKTIEDDALIFRIQTFSRWGFLTALFFFLFLFYVPLYFDVGVSKKSIEVYGWGLNTSRSIPLYVSPESDTTLIASSNLCSEPLLLLIVVCSALSNTLERATIRETWGNFSSPDYKLVFLLGTTDNITLQQAVEEEASIHNDLIQQDFVDSYNNLTLKLVMMLKFVKTKCQQVKYLFKADDDTFTYVPNLLVVVKLAEEKKVQNLLIGKLICKAKPIRYVGNKWFVPEYMFNEDVYPPYLSGMAYLMHRNTALRLYEAALKIPYLHLEDVFITGLCAREAKIRPRYHFGFYYNPKPQHPCLYLENQNVIASHRITVEQMRQVWPGLNNGTVCPKRTVPAKLYFYMGHCL